MNPELLNSGPATLMISSLIMPGLGLASMNMGAPQ